LSVTVGCALLRCAARNAPQPRTMNLQTPASPAAETAAGLLLLKSMPVEYLNVCAGPVCVNPFCPLASMWDVEWQR
jgi:hypothetical protein